MNSVIFYFNEYLILERIEDDFFFNADENFRKRVELNVINRFTISFKQDSSQLYNINESLYSIKKLIEI